MGTSSEVTLGRLQDVIFQRLKDVDRRRPQIVGRVLSLALHTGPYGDVHKTTFKDVLTTSSGRNFAEWVHTTRMFREYHLELFKQIAMHWLHNETHSKMQNTKLIFLMNSN